MDIEKRIESLEKDLETLMGNLKVTDNKIQQLQMQRTQLLNTIVTQQGRIQERRVDLKEKVIKEAKKTTKK